MKYVLLGKLGPASIKSQGQRVKKAKAKLKQLGIAIEAVYYVQGQYDFVDVVEVKDPKALLAFSVWYARSGHGTIQSLPAFDERTMARAVARA
jgi:uncharacterized protein with GYD domain